LSVSEFVTLWGFEDSNQGSARTEEKTPPSIVKGLLMSEKARRETKIQGRKTRDELPARAQWARKTAARDKKQRATKTSKMGNRGRVRLGQEKVHLELQ